MYQNDYSLFMNVWPWIGLGIALVILTLMFATGFLNVDKDRPRCYDLSWLAWLAGVQYLLHNVEEYGIDFTGTVLSFPTQIVNTIGTTQVSELAYLGCNIPTFWVAAPIAAVLARKHRGMALGMACFAFFNGLNHIFATVVLSGGYNPGLVTGCCLFIPVFIWICYVWIRREKRGWSLVLKDLGVAVLYHAILYAGLFGARSGILGPAAQGIVMTADAGLALLLWWRFAKSDAAGDPDMHRIRADHAYRTQEDLTE